MKLLIVIHHRFELWRAPGWFGERLAEHFPELEVVQRDSYEGIDEHLRDAEIIFTISLRPDQLATTRTCGGFMLRLRRYTSFCFRSCSTAMSS